MSENPTPISMTQWEKAEPHLQIRPRGLAPLVGKLIVVEREHQTGSREGGWADAPFKRSTNVACGVLESAHRTDRNATSAGETTLIFRGGGQITFSATDLVIVSEIGDEG